MHNVRVSTALSVVRNSRFTADEAHDLIQHYLSANPDPTNDNVSPLITNQALYLWSPSSLFNAPPPWALMDYGQ